MAKLTIYALDGKVSGDMKASDRVFEAPINEHIVNLTLNWYLASRRQGTANAKTRAEVSGGGKKPWRQKGTGRARIGDNRAPHWRHGGVVFPPKPKDFSFSVPKNIRKAAIRSILSDKAKAGKIKIVDSFAMTGAKTKEMVNILKALGVKSSALIVLSEADASVERASRNIKGVNVAVGKAVNVFELLKHDELVMTKSAVQVLEEAFV
jgi:large subunit ribosomal protein L4